MFSPSRVYHSNRHATPAFAVFMCTLCTGIRVAPLRVYVSTQLARSLALGSMQHIDRVDGTSADSA